MEYPKVFRTARIWVAICAAVVVACLAIGLDPAGHVCRHPAVALWRLAHLVFGLTQHAGMAEDVLDHRLNSRTVYMNPVLRFLYWNMNYHVEHHMFPMVPYHALPALHEEMKADCPTPYRGLLEAYREIIPTLLRQVKDPAYHVVRELPAGARPYARTVHGEAMARRQADRVGRAADERRGWVEACAADDIDEEDVHPLRPWRAHLRHLPQPGRRYFATDGLCTHEQFHLADGFVMDDDHRMPEA